MYNEKLKMKAQLDKLLLNRDKLQKENDEIYMSLTQNIIKSVDKRILIEAFIANILFSSFFAIAAVIVIIGPSIAFLFAPIALLASTVISLTLQAKSIKKEAVKTKEKFLNNPKKVYKKNKQLNLQIDQHKKNNEEISKMVKEIDNLKIGQTFISNEKIDSLPNNSLNEISVSVVTKQTEKENTRSW